MTEYTRAVESLMVRALLDGRKTQDRRVVKPQPEWNGCRWVYQIPKRAQLTGCSTTAVSASREWHAYLPPGCCPYGVPGDLLWVRETWAHYHTINSRRLVNGGSSDEISDGIAAYRADGFESIEDFRQHVRLMSGADLVAVEINGDRWRPSIHMPRWASRLTLRLTDVRVERVQDISEEDTRAEGIQDGGCLSCGESSHPEPCGCDDPQPDYCDAFVWLWNSINEQRGHGWHANPWVWALTFDVLHRNVDDVLREPTND